MGRLGRWSVSAVSANRHTEIKTLFRRKRILLAFPKLHRSHLFVYKYRACWGWFVSTGARVKNFDSPKRGHSLKLKSNKTRKCSTSLHPAISHMLSLIAYGRASMLFLLTPNPEAHLSQNPIEPRVKRNLQITNGVYGMGLLARLRIASMGTGRPWTRASAAVLKAKWILYNGKPRSLRCLIGFPPIIDSPAPIASAPIQIISADAAKFRQIESARLFWYDSGNPLLTIANRRRGTA